MSTPKKNFLGDSIDKSLLTPCRRIGLSRKFKTPNTINKLLSSPIITVKKDNESSQIGIQRNTPLKKINNLSESEKLNSTPPLRMNIGLSKTKKRLLTNKVEEQKKIEMPAKASNKAKKNIDKNEHKEKLDMPVETKSNVESTTVKVVNPKEEINSANSIEIEDVTMQNISDEQEEEIVIKKRKTNRIKQNEPKSQKLADKKAKINPPIIEHKAESDSSSEGEINLAKLKKDLTKEPHSNRNSIEEGKTDAILISTENSKETVDNEPKKFHEVAVIVEKVSNKSLKKVSSIKKESSDSEDDFIGLKRTKLNNIIKSDTSIKSGKLSKQSTKPVNKRKNLKRTSTQSKISSTYLSDSEDDFTETPKRIKTNVSMNSIPELAISQSKVLSFGKFHIESPQIVVDEELLRNEVYELSERVSRKRKQLDELKRAVIYKKMHNVKELSELTLKWKNGCKQALISLHAKLNENLPISMEKLMQNINVPKDILTYDQENGCFKE